eukprot:3087471-Rhodomonas_salina.5
MSVPPTTPDTTPPDDDDDGGLSDQTKLIIIIVCAAVGVMLLWCSPSPRSPSPDSDVPDADSVACCPSVISRCSCCCLFFIRRRKAKGGAAKDTDTADADGEDATANALADETDAETPDEKTDTNLATEPDASASKPGPTDTAADPEPVLLSVPSLADDMGVEVGQDPQDLQGPPMPAPEAMGAVGRGMTQPSTQGPGMLQATAGTGASAGQAHAEVRGATHGELGFMDYVTQFFTGEVRGVHGWTPCCAQTDFESFSTHCQSQHAKMSPELTQILSRCATDGAALPDPAGLFSPGQPALPVLLVRLASITDQVCQGQSPSLSFHAACSRGGKH